MATELGEARRIDSDRWPRGRASGRFIPVDPGPAGSSAVPDDLAEAVRSAATGLPGADPGEVLARVERGAYAGMPSAEVEELAIGIASALIAEDPAYSRLAARLLSRSIGIATRLDGISGFAASVERGHAAGLVGDGTADFVRRHQSELEAVVDESRDDAFEYFGSRVLADRYLLKDPLTRRLIERPQHFFLRVACGLSESVQEAVELYELLSMLDYLPSTPTLFNSGTRHPQMSSCYLHDSPADDLRSIYDTYTDVALLSKFSGGIGLAFHRVRARGSLIRGTNGLSSGIVPFLKTLDSSVAAVNQGGKRKGAACVYLETWHADIEEFLELRDNTGDEARRTHNLNIANWIPDLFMERVVADAAWSLFDPADVPALPDLWGDPFRTAYEAAERAGLARRIIPARQLYGRMIRTLAETGNGWMTFKDASNAKANQTARPDNVIHLSNLCTEILEVSSEAETAVCNLGAINLARHLLPDGSGFDWAKLGRTVETAVKFLDRTIDRNFYPTPQAEASNRRWRPVGLGLMGLQDVFFALRLPFDSPAARDLSRRISEAIYFHALDASCRLAAELGAHPAFAQTRAANGELQFDLWGVSPTEPEHWDELRRRIKVHGLRNALLVAIAPTATIASIAGVYECIEPQVSNLFKRETLSGDFLQVNRYLVRELKDRGLWTEAIRARIKNAEGSVQGIEELPDDVRSTFRTAWELPQRSLIDMAADRGAFIDQSQSLNLFVESPTIGRLSSMYLHAWERGLKTTYYLRSRPATSIAKVTTPVTFAASKSPVGIAPADTIACSLENPESCEACQ